MLKVQVAKLSPCLQQKVRRDHTEKQDHPDINALIGRSFAFSASGTMTRKDINCLIVRAWITANYALCVKC